MSGTEKIAQASIKLHSVLCIKLSEHVSTRKEHQIHSCVLAELPEDKIDIVDFLITCDFIVARKERTIFFFVSTTLLVICIDTYHSYCGTLACMMKWHGCNPVFTLPRNTHYFPLKDLVKVNLLFGNRKHYIKRKSCSLTRSNHCCSSPSYLGVSLGAVVKRPQRNILAMWLYTDQ